MSVALARESYRGKLALLLGGAGSGNFGHAGRPGEVGGSADDDEGTGGYAASPATTVDVGSDLENADVKQILWEKLERDPDEIQSSAAKAAKQEVNAKLSQRLKDDPAFQQLLTERTPVRSGSYGAESLRRRAQATYQEYHDDVSTHTDDAGRVMDQDPPFARDMEERVTDPAKRDAIEAELDRRAQEGMIPMLIHQWAETSGDHDPLSIALQLAARDEFKLKASTTDHFKDTPGLAGVVVPDRSLSEAQALYERSGAGLRAFLRAQYDETQQWLKDHGIKEVTVYRGVGGEHSFPPEYRHEHLAEDDAYFDQARPAPVDLQPVSSFSLNATQARSFGQMVISMKVPAKLIMSTPRTGVGCLGEQELTVLGGRYLVLAHHFDPDVPLALRPGQQSPYARTAARLKKQKLLKDDPLPKEAWALDADLDNADWTKRTWDLPYRTPEAVEDWLRVIGITVPAFKQMPVYTHALPTEPWLAEVGETRLSSPYQQKLALLLGDFEGHPFRGNQWTDVQGTPDVAKARRDVREFVGRILKPDGGFSYRVTTKREPRTGFMVSVSKGRERVVPAKKVDNIVLGRFVRENWEALQQPGNYFGAWHNPQNGKVYLDVTKHVMDPETAHQLAKDHKQLAYFDLNRGKSVPVKKAKAQHHRIWYNYDGERDDGDTESEEAPIARPGDAYGRQSADRAGVGGFAGEIDRATDDGERDGRDREDSGHYSLGGAGSGNFGHAGRPGEIGGSASDAGGESVGGGSGPPAPAQGVEPGAGAARAGGQVVRPARDRAPNDHVRSGIQAYNEAHGLSPVREGHFVAVNIARAQKIAEAYDALPVVDDGPETKRAYAALGKEIQQQWDFAQEHLGIEFIPWKQEGQPYANSQEMREDVAKNKRLYFFTGGEEHPFLKDKDASGLSLNDKFRAVHDLFGHSGEDYQFGPRGEENAWLHHSQMFTPDAQRALTTETRGQNAWVNFGPQNYNPDGTHKDIPAADRPFAAQKAAVLPLWASEWQSVLDGETKKLRFDLPNIQDVNVPSLIGTMSVDTTRPKPKKRRRGYVYKGVRLSRRPTHFETHVLALTEIPPRLDAARDAVSADPAQAQVHLADIATFGAAQIGQELVRQGASPQTATRMPVLDLAPLHTRLTADRAAAVRHVEQEFEARLEGRALSPPRRTALLQDLMATRMPGLERRFAAHAVNAAFAYGRAAAIAQFRRPTYDLAYRDDAGKFIGKAQAVSEGYAIVDAVIQSCVMDTNSCDECVDVDGEQMELGSDRQLELHPPYVKCAGGDRCRCTQIVLLADGSEMDIDEIDEDLLPPEATVEEPPKSKGKGKGKAEPKSKKSKAKDDDDEYE